MEVFPERDGNPGVTRTPVSVGNDGVRMEVFPERDGNQLQLVLLFNFARHRSEWRSSLKGMETDRSALSVMSSWIRSEWRSSLKGMETAHRDRSPKHRHRLVRMKVFPERDGNSESIESAG